MASTAISAQGSKVEIATGSGGAKTITGITQANPAVFTSAAHGLSRGDVVAIASVAGMTQVNGLTGIVQYVTTNTFVLAGVDSSAYTAYSSGGTATPSTWTQVANVKTFDFQNGAAQILDASNLQSTAKEKRVGLPDEGSLTMEIDLDPTDTGQQALLTARSAQTARNVRITTPNATTPNTATFNTYTMKVTATGGVDALMRRSVEMAINGAVTWA